MGWLGGDLMVVLCGSGLSSGSEMVLLVGCGGEDVASVREVGGNGIAI